MYRFDCALTLRKGELFKHLFQEPVKTRRVCCFLTVRTLLFCPSEQAAMNS